MVETMFPGVLFLLRQLAGSYALQVCYKQMEESVFYRVEVVPLPHGVRNWVRSQNLRLFVTL